MFGDKTTYVALRERVDDRQHFETIYQVVRSIPPGFVMSYGQVGQEAGGVSARTVGWAMANALDGDVPWQRVVGVDGYLRIGRRSVQLQDLQRLMLEREGVAFLENGCVDMPHHQVSDVSGAVVDDRSSQLIPHPGGGTFRFG